jgi:hypothetical protein
MVICTLRLRSTKPYQFYWQYYWSMRCQADKDLAVDRALSFTIGAITPYWFDAQILGPTNLKLWKNDRTG